MARGLARLRSTLCKFLPYRFLFAALPGTKAPDAKWGLVQLAFSLAFFLFALFISSLSVYMSFPSVAPMVGEAFVRGFFWVVVVLGGLTTLVFAYTVWLGIQFNRTSRQEYNPNEIVQAKTEVIAAIEKQNDRLADILSVMNKNLSNINKNLTRLNNKLGS